MVTPISNVTDRVLEALQNDPRTKDAVIDVAFFQGTMTLTGTVRSEQVHQAAVEIARSDPSVVNVVDELKVK
jgi:osmotically-inducible protein OsmY